MIKEEDAPLDADQALAEIERILRKDGKADLLLPAFAGLARAMAKHGHRRTDPVRSVMANMGDRWSTLILLVLEFGTFRYAALQRLINALAQDRANQISQRMLTLRLRALERDGLVVRHATRDVPPQVDYSLTDFGQGLIARGKDMIVYINANDAHVRVAREVYLDEA